MINACPFSLNATLPHYLYPRVPLVGFGRPEPQDDQGVWVIDGFGRNDMARVNEWCLMITGIDYLPGCWGLRVEVLFLSFILPSVLALSTYLHEYLHHFCFNQMRHFRGCRNLLSNIRSRFDAAATPYLGFDAVGFGCSPNPAFFQL